MCTHVFRWIIVGWMSFGGKLWVWLVLTLSRMRISGECDQRLNREKNWNCDDISCILICSIQKKSNDIHNEMRVWGRLMRDNTFNLKTIRDTDNHFHRFILQISVSYMHSNDNIFRLVLFRFSLSRSHSHFNFSTTRNACAQQWSRPICQYNIHSISAEICCH